MENPCMEMPGQAPSSDLLPDQVVFEILTRLPAKSICRFNCVSKRWYSLVCNPHFITSYLSLSSPKWAILDRTVGIGPDPTSPGPVLALSEPPAVTRLSFGSDLSSSVRNPFSLPEVIAAGDGLFLFSVIRRTDRDEGPKIYKTYISYRLFEHLLFVCDPVTGRWAGLPNPHRGVSSLGCVGLATRRNGPEVGFVVAEYQHLTGSNDAIMLVFRSESGEWEERHVAYPPGGIPGPAADQEGAFFFDGRLFWVDLSAGLIAWDDPFSRGGERVECRMIPLPPGSHRAGDTEGQEEMRSVQAGGGCIQYMEVVKDGGSELRVWRLMGHDEGSGEWSLVHKVGFRDIWDDEAYLACGLKRVARSPAFVHPLDPDVFFICVGGHIVCVDARVKKVLSCVPYSNGSEEKLFMPVVLSPWPTTIPPPSYSELEKNRGNEFFKDKEFDKAVGCYTRSINYSATAAAYANRAAAYLKIGRYLEAESDCTEALKLDDKYMKAYGRRAMARKEVGKLAEAKGDAAIALQLDPKQREIVRLYAGIESLLEQEASAEA